MIRVAERADIPLILRCITELARYEKLEDQLELDAEELERWLFDQKGGGTLIAEKAGEPIGFALYFPTFSTFRTRVCMHLEDLFVFPEHRGSGHGLMLLRAVAKEAVRLGCPRMDWNVLDWNEPAIGFYRAQGAQVLPDWRTCRLEGDALATMASAADEQS